MPATGTALLSAAGTAAATAVVGAVVSQALAPKQKDKPQQQQQITQADKPQEVKQVDQSALQKKNALAMAAGGSLSGNSGTLLTGSSGVNSNSLNLGTSTLLGQ